LDIVIEDGSQSGYDGIREVDSLAGGVSVKPEGGIVRDFLKRFEVILFDMGDTFMFDCDRFSDREDYLSVYRALGGSNLGQERLSECMNTIYVSLLALGRDKTHHDAFPTLSEFITAQDTFKDLSAHDTELLTGIFGMYECGEIPESSRRVLRELSNSHRLGLISNVWSDSGVFRAKLMEAGVHDLFSTLIFSSDHGAIKPSSILFKLASDYFGLRYDQLVYIGNSYKRDIVGAKSVGMTAILVDNGPASEITGELKPDYVVRSIVELIS
jgi:FMN phosphatase YigB (HAD superfamily)